MWRRGSPGPRRPLLVAHRGGAALAGGDPVEGVRRLVALGADMVEFDVRTPADGVPVVHHDARAGGVPLRGRSLAAHAAAGARLPTLEAFLEAAAGRIALDVELKERGGEERVMGAVRAGADPERVVVT